MNGITGLYDIHCHIVPGVDDGPKSFQEAEAMLHLEYENGVRTVIATPHYRRGMFETEQKVIIDQFERLQKAAGSVGIQLYLGCEYHVDNEMAGNLLKGSRPSMAGSAFVLTEFGGGVQPKEMQAAVYELLSAGWRPVIAHVERYGEVAGRRDFLRAMVQMGALIQVNAGSVLGEEGFFCRRMCARLMRENLIHFIGSDGHGIHRRKPQLASCAQYVERKYGGAAMRRLFIDNPAKIIGDQRRYKTDGAESTEN